uniref:Uncharacterized protein n=1 Tax=Rhizophora mucronata TaxID=61149 RepID=A0A2P2QIA5_RHIMU
MHQIQEKVIKVNWSPATTHLQIGITIK